MKPVREGNGTVLLYPTVADVKSPLSKDLLYKMAKEHGVTTHNSSGTGMLHTSEYFAARYAARAVAFALIDEATAAGISVDVLEKLQAVADVMAP